MKSTEITLETLASILIRCFWIGLGFVVVWFLLFFVIADFAYGFHKRYWEGLTRHQFAMVNFCAMGLFKLGVFGFFLIPYLGIRGWQKSTSDS